MRRIIKEQLDELKFKRNKKMILSFLNTTVLPKFDWVCKFDVEQMPSSGGSIMVVIYADWDISRNRYQDDRYKLIDEIWEYIYEYIGVATYERFEYVENCDKENITESRRDKVMTDYFNEIFNVAEMNWRSPWEIDDDGNEYEDTLRVEFYYGSEFDDDTVFRYYDKGFFREGSLGDRQSPLLSIEGEPGIKLDGYFGNNWHEPFKVWFRNNFGLDIKTIETQEH